MKRSSSEVLLTRLAIAASLYQEITISLIGRIEKHDWRYVTLTPVRVIIALTLFLYACDATSGDEYERFVNWMCHQSMQSEETLPDTEIDKFCDCASDEVARNWSSRQQASIREARKLLANSEPPPAGLFQRSGLDQLVGRSQEICLEEMYPTTPKITDEQHENFSYLANKSVEEFTDLMDSRCDAISPSPERDACLKNAGQEWLRNRGAEFDAIPDNYITGNDLAMMFINGEDN